MGGVINRLTVPASNAEETRMHWFASSAQCEGQHSTLILIPKIGGPRHDQPGPALKPGPCRALHGQAAGADRLARRGRRGGAERGLGEDVLECRPAPRPYVVSFASLIASSSVENTPTDSTGPKISSRTCGGDDAHQQTRPQLNEMAGPGNGGLTIFMSGVMFVKTAASRHRSAQMTSLSGELRPRTRRIHVISLASTLRSANDKLRALCLSGLDVRPDLVILHLGDLMVDVRAHERDSKKGRSDSVAVRTQ